MRDKMLRGLFRYGAAVAVAGLMAYFVTRSYHLADAASAMERYRILCDAFTVPGVVFVMLYALLRIAEGGLMDGLTYAMRSLYRVFLPMGAPRDETFYDYVQRKKEKRKKGGMAFILHTGLLFMVPALIFLVLFYRLYQK